MSRPRRRDYLDPETADMISDDLPDGAYMAMMEELTGMDPVDAILSIKSPNRRERKRRNVVELEQRLQHGCNRCNRRFRTKRGLEDHTRDTHDKRSG